MKGTPCLLALVLFSGLVANAHAQQSSTTPYRLSSASDRSGNARAWRQARCLSADLHHHPFRIGPAARPFGLCFHARRKPRRRECRELSAAALARRQRQRHDRCRLRCRLRHRSSRRRARVPLADGGAAWTFAPTQHFTLEAEIRPVANEPPRISWKFTARTPGWYTVGYTGAPASDPATADGFLQPLIWQEKRFPRAPLLSAESMGGLPLTLVTRAGVTHGLSVDPRESPFRLPTIANARFGVMLRNPKGQAQPAAFAPLLGQSDSRFAAGQSCDFRRASAARHRRLVPGIHRSRTRTCSASSTTAATPGSRSTRRSTP